MEKRPEVHLIGNAHLDPIWLWRWQEGCGEVLQTFRSALDRLNEYPDFVFTCSSAAYYRWVEEIDPDMFDEIRARIKEGRWVPVNGWWVQPDCNIPSAESFARHALYSQLYYYEKFGIICNTGYNVDSFGHNYMLPQLLKQGRMDHYVMMRPGMHENDTIPENAFWWDSPDGSRVLTYRIPESYGESGHRGIQRALDLFEGLVDKRDFGMMLFYGVGNHGGGPTRGDIEFMMEKMGEEGYSNIKFSSPNDYFKYLLANPLDLPVWKDDLQHHASGCYSATSMVKRLNRLAENALQNAEKWNTLAAKTTNMPAQTENFAEAWKDVLFNQFHDILDGCSIMEAYNDVNESMGHAMTIAARAQNNAHIKIARNIDTWIDGVSEPVNSDDLVEVRHNSGPEGVPRPVVVFNPNSWDVEAPVRTHHASQMVKDSEGNKVICQNVRASRSNDDHADTVFLAKVPAMGYATYWVYRETEECGYVKSKVFAEVMHIENEHMCVDFDAKTGTIWYIGDRHHNYLRGNGAVPQVIDDHESDTWAHMVFKFHNIKDVMKLESIEMVETGPLRAVVRTKHVYGNSYLIQNFILEAGQKTMRVECKALWQEKFTMLKMSFPVAGTDEISTHEVAGAYIKRPCNGEEEPMQKWVDVTSTNQGVRRGLAIINDSKYSCDCPGSEVRLTALRNVIFADHYSPRPPADFNFTDEGLQRFEYGIYLHEGEVENSDIVKEATLMNNKLVTVPESYHKGTGAPQVKSYLSIDADNVIATALKLSEDGSGAIILRCYETKGKACRAAISSEDLGFAFWSDFEPHKIKTFRIEPDGMVKVVDFLEGIVK
ncbi:MAG: alpha-mannosidase [Clostridia bacterium]|nr:alpha-mannosidase [Clostridia bacterium]